MYKNGQDFLDIFYFLEQDVLEYNPDAELWVDKQKQINSTHFVKLDEIKEQTLLVLCSFRGKYYTE